MTKVVRCLPFHLDVLSPKVANEQTRFTFTHAIHWHCYLVYKAASSVQCAMIDVVVLVVVVVVTVHRELHTCA